MHHKILIILWAKLHKYLLKKHVNGVVIFKDGNAFNTGSGNAEIKICS
jgi:hypothetical protein